MYTRRAFTLIELLIVIAIIAILAAILFPVFATAREKARQTSCSSNLKQIGLAITQYEQDFDETPPDGNSHTYSACGWAGQIYPYVKSKQVFVCPDDSTPAASCSYLYNQDIMNFAAYSGNANLNPPAYPLSTYSSVAKTVLLAEVQGSGGYDISDMNPADVQSDLHRGGNSPDGLGGNLRQNNTVGYDPDTSNASGSTNNIPTNAGGNANFTLKYATGYPSGSNVAAAVFVSSTGVHSLGANYLLSDGHVKWLKASQTSAGNNNTNGSADTCGGWGNNGNYEAATTACAGAAATWSIY
ncbi:MAG: DUF1559 domain-containing protein [Capsulimonadaceae bacterium]|nr:DUF1559 domain-containing protein [Capsulimonadaceae bacterium]